MPGRGRNQATRFSNKIPPRMLLALVTTHFSSLLMASRIGLFTTLIPLQAKGAENIVRHGPSLSPGTLTVLPALACRLESAWKFPGHSDLLSRCTVKSCTGGSNPLSGQNPGEILAKSTEKLAERLRTSTIWLRTKLESDASQLGFYVFYSLDVIVAV